MSRECANTRTFRTTIFEDEVGIGEGLVEEEEEDGKPKTMHVAREFEYCERGGWSEIASDERRQIPTMLYTGMRLSSRGRT